MCNIQLRHQLQTNLQIFIHKYNCKGCIGRKKNKSLEGRRRYCIFFFFIMTLIVLYSYSIMIKFVITTSITKTILYFLQNLCLILITAYYVNHMEMKTNLNLSIPPFTSQNPGRYVDFSGNESLTESSKSNMSSRASSRLLHIKPDFSTFCFRASFTSPCRKPLDISRWAIG